VWIHPAGCRDGVLPAPPRPALHDLLITDGGLSEAAAAGIHDLGADLAQAVPPG
jgi:hypothetical protein